jgi:hypothetical protein
VQSSECRATRRFLARAKTDTSIGEGRPSIRGSGASCARSALTTRDSSTDAGCWTAPLERIEELTSRLCSSANPAGPKAVRAPAGLAASGGGGTGLSS